MYTSIHIVVVQNKIFILKFICQAESADITFCHYINFSNKDNKLHTYFFLLQYLMFRSCLGVIILLLRVSIFVLTFKRFNLNISILYKAIKYKKIDKFVTLLFGSIKPLQLLNHLVLIIFL